jgi:hypothetical protein
LKFPFFSYVLLYAHHDQLWYNTEDGEEKKLEALLVLFSATMNEEINHFVLLDEISIGLQSIDPKTVLKLSQVRFLFDVLIRKYPLL